ncbi:Cytochrome c5 [hydrothermal vent metagenome]|uniref:Cytochrome c5 n=1 Tax=hydrothermal vent metagenome TaxID=652676 RepID=A0A3B0ZB88_9ZZZZ
MSHEDKVFFGNFVGVLAALVVIAFIFFFLAGLVTSGLDDTPESNARQQAKVEENIKPVGRVNVGSVPATTSAAPAAATGPRPGDAVYTASCVACHGTGVAGAPKLGDSAAWGARAAKGIDTLLANAINGINAMPPKGTCATCSDEEMKAAIEYILSQSGQ